MGLSTSLILLAAGEGRRLGESLPKALVPLAGRPLVCWSADTFVALEELAEIVLVVPAGDAGRAIADALPTGSVPVRVVEGGARRRDSVRAGLEAASGELVLVHDAARAFVDAALARRVLAGASEHGAAVPAAPVTDTLVRDDDGFSGEEVPRASVRAVQTPQGFRRPLLVEAHEAADEAWDAPDDGTMVRALGRPVALVDGSGENFKVTWPADLERGVAVLRAAGRLADEAGEASVNEFRVGYGWDVHPLVEGRPFDLVGVRVADERGPAGHSDGDALSHAVADAMLGAAGLGDIGTHFPDTDPAMKGIPGPTLLEGAVRAVAAAGWRAVQVDAVLIVDKPKIAPHRAEIRSRLAALLGAEEDAVSIKGKRSEGLGGLANAAGVGCQCVVTLRRTNEGS